MTSVKDVCSHFGKLKSYVTSSFSLLIHEIPESDFTKNEEKMSTLAKC